MSWTPVSEVTQHDAEMSTIKAIVGARTKLGTGPAMRLGIPGVRELSESDDTYVPNGNC